MQDKTIDENKTTNRYAMKPDTDRIADLDDVQNTKTSELRYRRLFEDAQDGILFPDA